ncbi:MAG: amidohydrolase [Blastocatellia bacterium]
MLLKNWLVTLRLRMFVLLLLFFGSADFAARSAETADLALINGRVWLGSDVSSFAEAVAIRGKVIVRVGTTAQIRELIASHTRVIDLAGRLVTPGFNDAHIHFLGGALGLSEIELFDVQSPAEIIERVGAYARKNPTAPWITGRGWQYTSFPGGLPTKSYLDAVVRDRPVFLKAYDGHSGWANSKALEMAGIKPDTVVEGFGEIVRDASGEPTGVLKEGAQRLITRIMPEPARERKLDALRQGMKLTASLGITSIQNASGSPEELSLYEELLKRDELTLRVSAAFSVGARTTDRDIDQYIAIRNRLDLNPMLRAGAIKFMLDGVIESHTAAMIDRYSDLPPEHGAPMGELALPADIYRELVLKLDRAGFQLYTHAIGDRAVREALNAYEAAQAANQRKNTRHRIEHIETISPVDLPRFAKLGVLPSMEPIHADPGTLDVWAAAVGIERLPYSFAWASFLKSGARLVFSSDWPASISLDPIRGLHSAVNRRTIAGKPAKGWIPRERINIADALRAYTLMGAVSSYEEQIKGRIAPGMLADLVVLSQDLFKINSMRIHETRVAITIFDGRVIYQAGEN